MKLIVDAALREMWKILSEDHRLNPAQYRRYIQTIERADAALTFREKYEPAINAAQSKRLKATATAGPASDSVDAAGAS